jgi:hypothetical protein
MSLNKTDIQKDKMIDALEQTFGIVSKACKIVGIHRATHYEWYNNDIIYKARVDEIEGVALDFVEDKLLQNIGNGKETSTIFYLKTKGKKRGYIERTQYEDVTETPQKIEIEIID